jgi:hypothetical protein
MPHMNNAQAMVASPILSRIALGFRAQKTVGQVLFPRAPVSSSSGKIITFGREIFMRQDTSRAPGANVRRITPKYGSGQYSLTKHDLDGQVPFEIWKDAMNVPGIDLGRRAIFTVQTQLDTEAELERADLARDVNNYASGNKEVLSGTSRWTQSASTPLKDIKDAMEVVRAASGEYPNVALFGVAARNSLDYHADFVDRIKYSTGGVVSNELIAQATGIKKIVTATNQAVEQNGTVFDVWGDDVILAYVPEAPAGSNSDNGEPSYGYDYYMEGFPLVYSPYWDSATRSWIYPFSDWHKPQLTGNTYGFLFKDAGDNS